MMFSFGRKQSKGLGIWTKSSGEVNAFRNLEGKEEKKRKKKNFDRETVKREMVMVIDGKG